MKEKTTLKKIFFIAAFLGTMACVGAVVIFAVSNRLGNYILWEESGRVAWNDDGTVALGEGGAAHGFYTADGALADVGEQVVCENGWIRGEIFFQQNAYASDYGLLLLCDFRQQWFYVEGNAYRFYRFSLTGDTETRIPVEIPVDNAAYEMEYLIVSEPDEKEFSKGTDMDWDIWGRTREAYTGRFVIADKNGMARQEPKAAYVDAAQLPEIDKRGFELIKSADDISVFPSAKGRDKVDLLMGGSLDKKAWAVIAFCDWEQAEVKDGDLVRYYSSADGGGSRYEEITLPDVEEEAVYQAFAYGLSDRSSVLVFPSFRIKLNRCYERPAGRE